MQFNFESSMNLTENVKNTVKNAATLVLNLRYEQIGSEHLLYGLSKTDCVASKMLSEYGVTSEAMKSVFEKNDRTPDFDAVIQVAFTPRAKEIFLRAQQLAMQFNHNFIGTEHLLLSILLDPDALADTILVRAFKVNIAELKQ
ncbi:MAG: Clp protease N-terminal domain-containing protein [Clostridia bacterium]|nr:Clp protease N-terminal domain-containing protein [Clostridia bacterium]